MKGKDLLSISDLSGDDIRSLILDAIEIKAKDIFYLRETRMVNGYRKISFFNHDIVVPKVPLREEVEVHVLPDTSRGALGIRVWWENRLVQSAVYPLKESPRVHFSKILNISPFYSP